MRNLYFDLTEELNAEGPIAVLASGQVVVFYRITLMSKDGDWILRETPEACRRALEVLARHGARYRPSAPLDVRWLAGGSREDVVVELAREADRLQQEDRARLETYRRAAEPYMREFQAADLGGLDLPEAHRRVCELAERRLPPDPFSPET